MNNNNDSMWMGIAFVALCFAAGPFILAFAIVTLTVIVPILIGGAILWGLCILIGNVLVESGHIKLK